MGFEELKERQSVMWGAGPFERIEATLADMHEALVDRLAPRRGERWLDVGCGTGGAAFVAARRGVEVAGVDLSPVLVETARRRADEEGLGLTVEVGDAEALPYEDASFDVVLSTVGVMFAPTPELCARELARVTRPGGRLGLTTWLSEGGVAEFFRIIASFQPPPPGIPSPLEWGREEVVDRLLGDAFELEYEERDSPYEPTSGEEAWEEFSTAFGPMRTVADALEPERREELRRVFVDYIESHRTADGIRQSREYMLTVGRRR